MAVSRKAMTEGIRTPIILCALIDAALQSLSQLRCQLPLHKGAGVLPHQRADEGIGPYKILIGLHYSLSAPMGQNSQNI